MTAAARRVAALEGAALPHAQSGTLGCGRPGEPAGAAAQIADASCRSCGACCAYSADWPRFSLEDDAALGRIPRALVADDESGMRCTGDRCAALTGDVGRATGCAIYADRPDVCRACQPGDEACRMARRRFGL